MTEVTGNASMHDLQGAYDRTDPAVRMEGVNKWYAEFHALKDIDLTVERGERNDICSPSSSGKKNPIRCNNQLESINKGRIVDEGQDLTAGGRNVHMVR